MEDKKIKDIGKAADLSSFSLSEEQLELVEILRSLPIERIGISPCEYKGELVTCLSALVDDNEQGQLVPLAILVDKSVFSDLTPLYDRNETKEEYSTHHSGSDE